MTDGGAVIDAVRGSAKLLTGSTADLDRLVSMVGDTRFVLIGEASHGTDEFYRLRADLTKRLIDERGFTAVAVEADWPDAYRVNAYVCGVGEDRSAEEALSGFRRFPAWMWRNEVVVEFANWLRARNANLPADSSPAGFYGLDLYSLNTSIEAVIDYLDRVDPDAAFRARERYNCFEMFSRDADTYGYLTEVGAAEPCEDEVVEQLVDLQRQIADYARRDGRVAEDAAFYAEQNARLVKNAEQYYRSMFRGRVSSWNLRDRHMVETLDNLVAYLDRHGRLTKVVVWAHNSHLGDARATEMGDAGEWNVGQLMREAHGDDTLLIGFTTHTGTVTAASDWGGIAETKLVVPSLPDSYERLFHDSGIERFWLPLRDDVALADLLRRPWLERAIGVIYRPETERLSHYFRARLSDQFDALIHIDETSALQPVERLAPLPEHELPATFPSDVPT
ncbi:MAG TPA: erythromycin esterase family protein [Thermomicrobiales bacterium]|nr:erythromycin esterase family protein [Thermomicrobiales bacterium]